MAAWDVIVIGAGAAGLLAGCRAAERGLRTLVLEKNRQPGVKILMSGGTRCNVTHHTDPRGIVAAYGASGRFLHSALSRLGPRELVAWLESAGVATKVEETGKVFPCSNRAQDVLDALLRRLHDSGAQLATGQAVIGISRLDNSPGNSDDTPSADHFRVLTSTESHTAKNLIVTTGGLSYPGSGTTGDGYRWAAEWGHTLVPTCPALVPLTTAAPWVKSLQGITMPDVSISLASRDGSPHPPDLKLARSRGSLLFAHFGLSGPAVLDVSRYVSRDPQPSRWQLLCDWLPHLSAESLRQTFDQIIQQNGPRQVATGFHQLCDSMIPQRLQTALLELAGVDPSQRLAELSKPQRQTLIAGLKQTAIPLTGTLGYKKAEVTAGGIALAEVDSRTMRSKRVPHLYFAGEILDLDGPIGGYNFQAAFSTGYLAGESVE